MVSEDAIIRYGGVSTEKIAIVTHSDGSKTFLDSYGRSVRMDASGQCEISTESIAKLRIDNIADLTSYTIFETSEKIVHRIVWRDGGEVTVTYLPDGKVLDVKTQHVSASLSPERELTLGKFRPLDISE